MRGRKPRRFLLAAHDKPILEQIARSRTLPWFQVQRARVVLAIAEGARVQTVAFQLQCDPSTVWRLCRRYEEAGLEGVLAEVPRAGHPIEISPCNVPKLCNWRVWNRSLRGCTLPTGAVRTWPAKRWLRALYRRSARACAAYSARGRLAAASHTLLENGASGCALQTAHRKNGSLGVAVQTEM
jgi:hypothetical protein